MAATLPKIEISSQVMENGLKFSLNNSNSSADTVALVGSVRAGAIYDSSGKFGTAEFVARLLTRGTRAHPSPSSISSKIEEIGAALQFTNNDERVRFASRCRASRINEMLDIISECLTSPAFSEEQIEVTRSEIISDLDSEKDETRTRAHRKLMSLVYGGEGEPYGRNSMGSIADVKKISKADITSFYETYYGPKATLLVCTGNFNDATSLASKIDSSNFGKWNSNSANSQQQSRVQMKSSSSNNNNHAKLGIIPMNHKSQVDIAMGMPAVPRNDNAYYPLALGNLLLGQIGLYGRLGQNVREERGVAYYSFSSLVSKMYGGHIGIYAGVNPRNTSSAIEGIVSEISRISSEKIEEEELSRGKRNMIGSIAISLDTSSERVSLIHEIEYYSLGGSEYFQRIESKIESITSDQILGEFAKYANMSKISMAVAGPIGDESKLKLPAEMK